MLRSRSLSMLGKTDVLQDILKSPGPFVPIIRSLRDLEMIDPRTGYHYPKRRTHI